MLRWKIAATTAGVVALGVSASTAIDRANDHTREVAEAAALVSHQRCVANNDTTSVVRATLRAQLQLTESRFENGQLTQTQYVFSRRVLLKNINRLDPQDCREQARLIRDAVNE
jgi:triphosphoribosyl-dephospho-CoA synthetase